MKIPKLHYYIMDALVFAAPFIFAICFFHGVEWW